MSAGEQAATPALPASAAGFARSADGARWVVAGPLTFANARAVLAQARALSPPTTGTVDCRSVAEVDSAAVAVLLAVKRDAAAQGATLDFAGVPPALATLAALYGVEEMLGG